MNTILIRQRAESATPAPWEVGICDPELDPVEWFRQHLSFSDQTDVWSVWCPEHPRTKGEYPRPDHAVVCAITGNGPDSEANAYFIASARQDVLDLSQRVGELEAQLTGHVTAEKVEALADYAHEAWAGWMRFLFRMATTNEDGSVTIPADLAARWQRQTKTPYADLSEDEKDSDRAEAMKIVNIISPPPETELPF